MQRISWPNRISIARILLVGPFVIGLIHLQDAEWASVARWSALVTFALMAISDGLDGYLARRLHQETAVGRFLDPLADKLLILFAFVLLSHEGTHIEGARLPTTVAVIAVGKDLIVVLGFCIIYFTTARTYIDPRRPGKWCTTVQLLTVITVLLYPNLPDRLTFVPPLLWWVASGLAILTIVHYFQLGRAFIAHHEPATVSGIETPERSASAAGESESDAIQTKGRHEGRGL